jgi:hypothetical protein
MVMTTPINTLPTTSLIWNGNFLWNDTCWEQGATPYFSSATTPMHKVMTTKNPHGSRSNGNNNVSTTMNAMNATTMPIVLKSLEIPIPRSPHYHVLGLLVCHSPQVFLATDYLAISRESLIGQRQPQLLLE